jgi:hypothetical protein
VPSGPLGLLQANHPVAPAVAFNSRNWDVDSLPRIDKVANIPDLRSVVMFRFLKADRIEQSSASPRSLPPPQPTPHTASIQKPRRAASSLRREAMVFFLLEMPEWPMPGSDKVGLREIGRMPNVHMPRLVGRQLSGRPR